MTIFDKRYCKLNEYVQTQYQNLYFQIEGFFNDEDNALKIYFRNFPTETFSQLVNYLSKFPEKEKLHKFWKENHKHFKDVLAFLTIDELYFMHSLYNERRSIGVKNNYLSTTKDAFVRLIPHIKNIQDKFSIVETGDKLIFSETPISLNFYVSQIDANNYILKLAEVHQIHQFFVFMSTYILINNTLYKANLPFDDETIINIFNNKFYFKKAELVYYKTIVGRQLSLFNHYLDFEENIEFPIIADNIPEVYFAINKSKNGLKIQGHFDYNQKTRVPITQALAGENLFKLSNADSKKWYYLPDEMMENVSEFLRKDAFYNADLGIVSGEWEVSKPQEMEYIKSFFFEKVNPMWHIVLSKELKKQFAQTILLTPEIVVNSDGSIDWFSYKVIYKYNEMEITQDNLRKFFNSGEKFFIAPDGSVLKIANRKVFDEIEEMIQYSKKDADYFHRMAIYRLPWIYELRKLNPAINIYGDKYLDEMYTALHKRALESSQQPHYSLKPIMRTYQKAGYEWLKMLEKFKLNGILADDMGLGKTLQAISVLTDLPPDSKSLIICPKTLLFNWVAEIEKFNPRLTYFIYEGSKEIRTNLLQTMPVQVVLCSYNLIQNDLDEFNKIYFDYLILDEAQHIKNHITLRAKAIKKIRARHKLAMTGTPLENSIMELWSAFDFLMPGYLPPLKKFKEILDGGKEEGAEKKDKKKENQGMERIKQYISPFILRRKKVDVLIELPDKQEQAIFCSMTEKQETHYVHVLSAIKKEVFLSGEAKFNYITMLAALTRLRQICDHPALINQEWLNESDISGKMDVLRELVEEALDNDRKILIFSQYVKMLKIIENMVKELKVQYEYMDGSTKDRKDIINRFNDNEKIKIFLISLKTGGFGINLTSADTVILVDPWWNPMVESQAIDRVHRIGQTKKVLVYKLITKGSVEEKIMMLQKKKRDLFENVIDQGESVLKSLDNDEIKSLFEYKN